jgi:hypothetical protein
MKHLKTFESYETPMSKEEMIQHLCNCGWEKHELEDKHESELAEMCKDVPSEVSEAKGEKWIQKIKMKKGALHKQLGYDEDEKIPAGIIKKIVDSEIGSTVKVKGEDKKVTSLLKHRAVLAQNLPKK